MLWSQILCIKPWFAQEALVWGGSFLKIQITGRTPDIESLGDSEATYEKQCRARIRQALYLDPESFVETVDSQIMWKPTASESQIIWKPTASESFAS